MCRILAVAFAEVIYMAEMGPVLWEVWRPLAFLLLAWKMVAVESASMSSSVVLPRLSIPAAVLHCIATCTSAVVKLVHV